MSIKWGSWNKKGREEKSLAHFRSALVESLINTFEARNFLKMQFDLLPLKLVRKERQA